MTGFWHRVWYRHCFLGKGQAELVLCWPRFVPRAHCRMMLRRGPGYMWERYEDYGEAVSALSAYVEDGTSGQDRESYTDDQDRRSYTVRGFGGQQ